jgi:hypothetical protein
MITYKMGDITQGIDGFFFLSLTTLVCGGLTLLIRFAYKSKCKSVEICCLKIDRDIETELKEDLQNPRTPSGRQSLSE